MAKCDYCNTYILFGGKKQAGRTFCNDSCLVGGKLVLAADQLPQHVVDAAIENAHRGECPECSGDGPVDVHNSHTIWSIVYLTSWKSTPNLCCRSCGRKHQLTGLLSSSVLGWWGVPWGVIFTPIQIGKNLSGMLGGPDPELPSEQLETIIRIELASRIAAGRPLPGQRKQHSNMSQATTEPQDDRIPVECDACGKRFKAKEEMAGRTGKCPGCGSTIVVPEPDVWLDDDDADVTTPADEWHDEHWDNDDESYDDFRNKRDSDWNGSSSGNGSSEGSSRKRSTQKKKSGVLRIALIVAGVFVALNVLAVIVGFAVEMLKNDRRPAPQIAQNDPPQVPNPGRPDFPSNDFQAPALPDFNFPQPNLNPPAAVPAPRLPDFPQGTPISGSIPVPPGTVSTPARGNTAVPNGEPIAAIASVEPLENVNPNGKVWVVLSNLREGTRTGFGSFNKPFLVDYQLASGSPVSTDNYVLHLSKSLGGGSFQQVADVPVKLETSGTIEFNTPPSFGPASGFVATMAVPNGRQKWTHLSGELTPGGTATAAVAPLSIVELAGADANGKLVVIANPKFAATPGLPTLEVGFVLQQPAAPTSYYFLVATTPTGQKVEFDIARNLRQATVNDESTFGGRLFGPGAQVKPPFTLHVEKRQSRYQSPIRPETPEVISNRINVAG